MGEALTAFRASPEVDGLLGAPLAATLAKLKTSELTRFAEWCEATQSDAVGVTDWEHREYFEVF